MIVVEQNIGFRFDIYERIHLPEGTLAIRDLEEIELTPYFQGIPGNEQTQLRGNLQLTAVYDSILEGAGKQTFIHRIPVEISLPIRTNDVSSQEIQVRIDQFDVELVSDRSLNVTGILSLAGWEQNRMESLTHDSDEFYADHQIDQERNEESPEVTAEVILKEQVADEPKIVNQAKVADEPEIVHQSMAMNQPVMEEHVIPQLEMVAEPIEQAETIMDVNEQMKLQDTDQAVASKPDMKVAIKPQSPVAAVKETVVDLPIKSEKANNSLEWKRLFLIKEDKVEFKQLRMCIVQKEDTLETIADRYELQPREIALYNRLGELDVSEGQIIYIPKSNV